MRYVALLLFLLFSVSAAGQRKVVDEIDEFKGFRRQHTEFFNIHQGTGRLRARVIKQGDVECLNLMWMFGPKNRTGIEKGAELIFKFEDGSMLTLYNHHSVSTTIGGASVDGVGGSAAQGMSFDVYLEPDDVKELLGNKIVKLRVYLRTGYADLILKDRNDEMLKSALRAVE